jgi:DNA-binding NtrC family response regulator
VRIICATNADLGQRVEQGTFRKDLFYRLKVGHIIIPPLRERREEILPLAELFLQEFAVSKGRCFKKIDPAAAELLQTYDWPGNVRELRNLMEWVAFMYDEATVKANHLAGLAKGLDHLVDLVGRHGPRRIGAPQRRRSRRRDRLTTGQRSACRAAAVVELHDRAGAAGDRGAGARPGRPPP